AGLLPNPTLNAGVDFPHHSDPPDNFTAYNVGLDWEITSLITHDTKVRAAEAQLKSVDLDMAWREWQIAQAAKTAALDVIALQLQLESARQADERLGENLKLVRHAVEQHQRTLLDESAAEVAAQDAHSAVLALQKDLKHQTLLLNQAVGISSNQRIELRGDGALPSRLQPPPLEQLIDGLEQRRLDLLALRSGYESQEATVRAAVLQQFPKITLGFNAARDTSNVHTFGLGVSIDIPVFDRNQGNIAIETASRQKLFDEYANRVFAARSDIATAIQDIESLNEELAAAEGAIPGLERLVQTYDAALQQRNVDVLSYYTAQSTLATRRVEVIKLRQQLAESWIALEIASGRILPAEGGDQ
ncbi:MAG TPA: TolC family protein, partial [Tepidisphaeraceae bacterium]